MIKLPLRIMHSLSIQAASGLVKRGNTFYVIADDELHLVSYNFETKTDPKILPLKKGTLPEDPALRKKMKPDWESLVEIENGILLAVPSGSTERRQAGSVVNLNNEVKEIDFSKIYNVLNQTFTELNIEGSCVFKNRLKLFQRGNGASGKNAVIDLDLSGIRHDILQGFALDPKHIISIKDYELGLLRGHKLDFTDACALDDTIWYLAVAEDSQSTYEDGKYFGAILGSLDADGNELSRYEIDCATKPEGLWVESEGKRLCFYVVTDADSRSINAALYFGQLL